MLGEETEENLGRKLTNAKGIQTGINQRARETRHDALLRGEGAIRPAI